MPNNKNMELNDEMLTNVAGGWKDYTEPKYELGDTVLIKFAGDDGYIINLEGTVIEMRLTPDGWQYKIRYEFRSTTYEHWYPEIAL